ncbi:MAG: AAA family ATPase [Desulfurococcales archaeon]|nr:AAA family ATPase [Desulfurococcales archaeon]
MPVIVVSGPPGGGKTTQAKKIAEYYNLRYHSAGSIFRGIAREKGISIEELSLIALRDPSIDIEIDRRSYEEALKRDLVLDGHLTAWIVSEIADVRILVTAPLSVRVHRIAHRDNKSFEDALRETITREYTQYKRFVEYYGIDPLDYTIFDIIVNTEKLGPEEAFEVIRRGIEKILKA